MTVVVGVDGAGRTHRLNQLAVTATAGSVRLSGTEPPAELDARLEVAAKDGAIVVVDDAHRLGPDTLRALTTAARAGQPMAIARRPTLASAELAELDEAVAAAGAVEQLAPLDAAGIAELIRDVVGRPGSTEQVAAVLAASAGLPAIAVALAEVAPGSVPPALVARVQRRLAVLDPAAVRLARVQALGLDLADDVLAAAALIGLAELAGHQRELRDAGLLEPGGERLVPAVAAAILADLPPAERRRNHDAVARALAATGSDPVLAATQLRAAGARSAVAAQLYRAAGERVRFTDPDAALAWFDDALDAGADPAELLAGRAEAAALAGVRVELDLDAATPSTTAQSGTRPDADRLALVAGAVAAHDGRADRASQALLAAAAPGPLLAVPALVGTGQLDQATPIAAGSGPLPLRRLAEAVLAGLDPVAAVPLLIEAADAAERADLAVVLPDTPHALGAVIAVTAGDASTAEHLLTRALTAGMGGPAGADRHRLLLAWVRMRAGRYDTAHVELRRVAGSPLSGRDRILAAAIAAGIARRCGDIARLRDTWAGVEQVLARRTVDLFQLEPVEELVVAAARLRQPQRIAPVLDELDGIVDRLGRPPAWAVTLGWVRLAVAIASDDETAAVNEPAAGIAAELAKAPAAGSRQRAQCAAAAEWADVLAGRIDADAVWAATEALAGAQLPWEASRLAGQAAIRTADPAVARRLLERARDVIVTEPAADARSDAGVAGLSDREVEVARLVLAGRTHKEIGAQLYIAPKTVEHHVARIRTKLGATSRAEFVAALRTALDAQDSHAL